MVELSAEKEWAREHLRGLENQLMPSFAPDMEALDEAGVRRDVRQTIDHGFFSTLVVSAGLDREETDRFVEVVVDEAGDDLAVSMPLMGDTKEQTLELVELGNRHGVDLGLIGYPMRWYPDDPREVLAFTREVCEHADFAIDAWVNKKFAFERFHPLGFPIDLFDAIADIPNVVGAKVSYPEVMGPLDRTCGDRLLLSCPIEGLATTSTPTTCSGWVRHHTRCTRPPTSPSRSSTSTSYWRASGTRRWRPTGG